MHRKPVKMAINQPVASELEGYNEYDGYSPAFAWMFTFQGKTL